MRALYSFDLTDVESKTYHIGIFTHSWLFFPIIFNNSFDSIRNSISKLFRFIRHNYSIIFYTSLLNLTGPFQLISWFTIPSRSGFWLSGILDPRFSLLRPHIIPFEGKWLFVVGVLDTSGYDVCENIWRIVVVNFYWTLLFQHFVEGEVSRFGVRVTELAFGFLVAIESKTTPRFVFLIYFI